MASLLEGSSSTVNPPLSGAPTGSLPQRLSHWPKLERAVLFHQYHRRKRRRPLPSPRVSRHERLDPPPPTHCRVHSLQHGGMKLDTSPRSSFSKNFAASDTGHA